jgi:hypothetical protein
LSTNIFHVANTYEAKPEHRERSCAKELNLLNVTLRTNIFLRSINPYEAKQRPINRLSAYLLIYNLSWFTS